MPSSHTIVDAVIWICWGEFAVVWIGGALYNAHRSPHVRRRSLRSSVWLLVAITIWLAVRLVIEVDALSYQGEPDALRWLGAALLVVATGFAIWARIVLGGTMWSSTPVAKEHHVLRTDSPYAVTRHPIYTGILGMLLGTAVALGFGAWLYVFVLTVVFFELRIRSEETLMSEAFPGAYDEYRRRVPQLIPGLRLLGSSES
jgi:protein-S-isoprenylcysteine O-methyltransferase Ste14